MGAKCNVTGCKSGREKSEKPIRFFRPQNQETLNLWQQAIQGEPLQWNSTYSLCQNHFEDSDIIKHKTIQGLDGPVMVELNCWKLANGVIPKLFLGKPKKKSREPQRTLAQPSPPEVQSCELPSPNKLPASTKINPKEASLPSSWYWQEDCLNDGLSICSKFEWLKKGQRFEYIKSIIVKRNTIRYFVRGQLVVSQDLETRFSTLHELVAFIKLFDDANLCGGCKDPRPEPNTPSDVIEIQEIRSKKCLLLAGENCCSECFKLYQSLKRESMNKTWDKNAPKSPSTTKQGVIRINDPPISEKLSNIPQSKVQILQLTSKAPLSDITNHHEEPGVFTNHDENHSLHETNDQSILLIEKSSTGTSVETTTTGTSRETNPTENYQFLPNNIINTNENNADVDLALLPDRDTVTLQNTAQFFSSPNASVWNLEQRIIKRPNPLKSSTKFPLALYHSHTWRYGVYSPFEPVALSSEVGQCSAKRKDVRPFFIRDWSSKQPSFLISRPLRIYEPRRQDILREQPLQNNAVVNLNEIQDMKTFNGKIHVTMKGESPFQSILDHNPFHVETAIALRRLAGITDDHQSSSSDDEEDKNDLTLARSFVKRESRIKSILQKKIMRLSQQLTRYKKIASSILTKTKQSQRVSPNHQPHEAKSERPAPKKVKKPRSKTECKVCGKLVLHMAKHLKIHSVGRSHLCDLCGRSFLHRTSLNAHIRYNHKGVKRPKRFLCTQCNFACDSKFGLQTHERTHTGEKPFDCRYCDRKFSQKPALQRHIRTHTGEKPYSCNICGTSYTARSTYVMHYRKIHEKEKSDGNNDGTKKRRSRKPNVVVYCCESCPKKFHRKLAFERHCATHTGLPVAVRCGQLDCDFTYSDLHQLRDHMTKYHPDKTFSCSVCSKIFLSKWNLVNHQSKHDDSLGFHCSYCPANLTTKSGLILHETIHTRDNPYECSVCKMRFHSPFLLKRHICEHRPDQANRKRSRVAKSAN